MLKQRLITGTILAIATILAIFATPLFLFVTLSTLLILFAAWEFSRLIGLKKYYARLLYVMSIAVLMYGFWHFPLKPLLWITLLWWCEACFLIITYPKTSKFWAKSLGIRAVMGVFTLIPTWLALNTIKGLPSGNVILLFMLLLVWGADIGAYFTGKRFGKRYLLPKVSPKKTMEGLLGGLSLSLLIAIIIGPIVYTSFPTGVMMTLWAVITVLFSIVGDLFESMLKREIGIKDTGNYLPGHGGLLDRIDSLTAAAPIFLLGLSLLS